MSKRCLLFTAVRGVQWGNEDVGKYSTRVTKLPLPLFCLAGISEQKLLRINNKESNFYPAEKFGLLAPKTNLWLHLRVAITAKYSDSIRVVPSVA